MSSSVRSEPSRHVLLALVGATAAVLVVHHAEAGLGHAETFAQRHLEPLAQVVRLDLRADAGRLASLTSLRLGRLRVAFRIVWDAEKSSDSAKVPDADR